MKKLLNIISAFKYYLITLLWLLIILLTIKGRNTPNHSDKLDKSQYESEAGFNYLEDTNVFE